MKFLAILYLMICEAGAALSIIALLCTIGVWALVIPMMHFQ